MKQIAVELIKLKVIAWGRSSWRSLFKDVVQEFEGCSGALIIIIIIFITP